MAAFMYEAVDRRGHTIKAEIEALNEGDAKHRIRTQDYYPTKVLAHAGAAAP